MDIQKLKALRAKEDYKGIIHFGDGIQPEKETEMEQVMIFAEAYEHERQYTMAARWMEAVCRIEPSEESYFILLNLYFGLKDEARLNVTLQAMEEQGYCGYAYQAARYEISKDQHMDSSEQLECIDAFLDEQQEDNYMIERTLLLLQMDEERQAVRTLKKLLRLYQSGKAAEFAQGLLEAAQEDKLEEYVKKHPWKSVSIFSYRNKAMEPAEDSIHATGILHETELSVSKNSTSKSTTLDSQPEKKEKVSLASLFGKSKKTPEVEEFPMYIEEGMKDIVGLTEVKKELNSFYRYMQFQKARKKHSIYNRYEGEKNFLIYGKSGMGKTTAAEVISTILKEFGAVGNGNVVTVRYENLVGNSADETFQKVNEAFKNAMDGILILDEMQEFYNDNPGSAGMDCISKVESAMEAAQDQVMIIATGEKETCEKLFHEKKRLASHFTYHVELQGYDKKEMLELLKKTASQYSYAIDEAADGKLLEIFQQRLRQKDYDYANDVQRLFAYAERNMAKRVIKLHRAKEEDYMLMKLEDFGEETEETESVEELLNQLDQMTGLAQVKDKVRSMINSVMLAERAKNRGVNRKTDLGTLHLVFRGNAGTGKTTVARIIGKIYKNLGVLQKGDVFVEVTRKDLVSPYVGETARCVEAKVKEAMGGILFIDEAYSLCRDDNDTYGKEAIDSLLTFLENDRGSLMVILAGYSSDMDEFLSKNQGLSSRLANSITFEDYTIDEMCQIFYAMLKDKGLFLETGAEKAVHELLEGESRKSDFGNARGVRNMIEKVMANQSNRLAELELGGQEFSKNEYYMIREEDILADKQGSQESGTSVEALLQQLNQLTGLASVKQKVQKMVDTAIVNQKLKEMNLPGQKFGTLHLVFKGNAGTGKTTVARLIGKIYKELGILSRGDVFVECGRSDLVAGYLGQTAIQVKKKVKEAMGGILFIDEAYSLIQGENDSYGHEAVDALVADIENYRDNLMVIVAGYSDDMDKFLAENQGLSSRLSTELIFEDYTVEEMMTIFKGMLKSQSAVLADGLDDALSQLLMRKSQASDFGNARGVRNVLEKVVENRNSRIAAMIREGKNLTKQDYLMICEEDLAI